MAQMVNFGEYMPDQPPYNNPGSSNIRNVLPRTPGSYGPMPNLVAITGALTARCQGGAFARDSGANVNGFAGDATKLYHQATGSTTWTDATRTVGGAYTIPADGAWNFGIFDQRVIATNGTDPIQSYVMGSSSNFALLSSGAPNARYIAVNKSFVMVANTTDGVNGPRPQRAWWCAIGDSTNWPTLGSVAATQVQSDAQDLLGDGGWNQGMVGGLSAADFAIFQERRIWRALYVGSPAIFSFTQVDSGRGTPAPGSIIQNGPVVYYLADSGFFAFDGAQASPIGDQKIDLFFWNDVDQNNLFRISAAVDPLNKIVYWAYPAKGNSGGNPNRILAYHYALQRWTLIDQIQLEVMLRGMTTGYTLEQLDPFGTLETLPYGLDSRVWTGGKLNLAAFDITHKLGFFSGANLAATLETSEASLNPNGIAYVNRVWPMVDSGSAMVALAARNRLADAVTYSTPVGITTTTGSAGVRSSGMFHRAQVTIPAGVAWQDAQGVQFDARPAGQR